MPERSVTTTNDSLTVALAAVRGRSGRTPNSKRHFLSYFLAVIKGTSFMGSNWVTPGIQASPHSRCSWAGAQRGWRKRRVSTMRTQAERRPCPLSRNCHGLGLSWHFAFPRKGRGALLVRGTLGTSTSHVWMSPGPLSAAGTPRFPPSRPKWEKRASPALLRGGKGAGGASVAPAKSERCRAPRWFPGGRAESHAPHTSLLQRGGWGAAERPVPSYKPRGSGTQRESRRKSIIKNKLGKRLASIWPAEQKIALLLEQEQVWNPGKHS